MLGLARLTADGGRHEFRDVAVVDVGEHGEHALVRAEDFFEATLCRVASLFEVAVVGRFRQSIVGGPVLGEFRIVAVAGKESRDIDRTDEGGNRDLALAVDLYGKDVPVGGFELKPGAPAGNELRRSKATAGLGIVVDGVVDARRADELADDDAFGAVDDEGAPLGHDGEVAEEEALFLDFAGLLDAEFDINEERLGEREVTLAALFFGVFRGPQFVVAKNEVHLGPGEVLDRRDLVEEFAQADANEPVEGIELDLNEVGDIENAGNASVRFDFARGNKRPLNEITRSSHPAATPSGL